MNIRASVGRREGRNCQNAIIDLEIVRTFLNLIPAARGGAEGSLRGRFTAGICSDALYEAILRFQRLHLRIRADGHIDPHGSTFPVLARLALDSAPRPARLQVGAATPIAPLHPPSASNNLGDGGTIINTEASRRRLAWNHFVQGVRGALQGNANYAAVTAYLERLERTSGPGALTIPNYIGFGQTRINGTFSHQNGAVLNIGSSIGTFEDTAVVLTPGHDGAGGGLLLMQPHSLMVLLGRYSFQTAPREVAEQTRIECGSVRGLINRLSGRH